MAEPYLSFSTPLYSDDPNNIFKMKDNSKGFIVTIGLRIGINKIKKYSTATS